MGDKLLLNFGAKFQRVSQAKFQRVSQAKMASRFKKVTNEEVTELKEAAENSNTRKSTIN